MNNPRLPYLEDKVTKLPIEPGVYIMRNKAGEIIYIGKAKALRNRVTSYFRQVEKHTEKTYRLVENIHDLDYIVTSSEFEALVLEASMIKQYRPKYNILLKDDKGYNYIKITNEPYPRITAEKSRDPHSKDTFLGPYTSSLVVNQTVDAVSRGFMLPTCNRKFPEDFRKGRPCLNYHIKRCMGVCTGKFSQQEYAQIIKQALRFIDSGSGPILEELKKEMNTASDNLEFEKAAELRDKIDAIERITDEQNVIFVKSPEQDVVALAQSGDEGYFSVLKIRNQRLVDKQDFYIKDLEDQATARREFLTTYYTSVDYIPPAISVDGEVEDIELLSRYFTEKAGRQTTIHIPQRGERVRLVEMARQNAAQMLSHRYDQTTGRELAVLDELARLIGMDTPPAYIEAYDISNMGDDTIVGGMVVFKDARPYRSAYRKFNIQSVTDKPDDYAAMSEMLSRRLVRYEEEKDTGKGFGRLPDLILLDGGKGHVSTVKRILDDLGFSSIPLFGLVKDRSHRTRAIATTGDEISIQSTRQAFTLLSTIQDEVHRFTISHMKSRHTKSAFETQLTSIPQIGDKRAFALLKHFKTNKAIREASVDDLTKAPGMTITAAENVYNYFNED